MALSSDDVVNWQLKTGMRGYLIPQVDELLDEVADELDRLHARIRDLEAEREAVRTSLDDQLEVEETLRRTLYQAQKAADQTVEDARTNAERIVADGRLEADAILAAAREKAQAAYDEAIREATVERAKVRAALEAEETRMRAVRSELRNEIEHLRTIESETRRLLRGLYDDRLNELATPGVEIPELGEVEEAEAQLVSRAQDPATAPIVDEALVAPEPEPELGQPGSGEASVDEAPIADEPHAAEEPEADADDWEMDRDEALVTPPAPDAGPRGPGGAPVPSPPPTSSLPLTPDTEPVSPPGSGADTTGREGEPYLDAVQEALAAIHANDEEDRLEDDLLPSDRGEGEPPVRPEAEDLFEGAPRRRRRRSG